MVVSKPNNWARQLGKQWITKHEKHATEKRKKARVYRKYEYAELESFKQNTSSGRMRLESFEKALRYLFEHSNVRLGYLQKRLLDIITIALLMKFFENDLIDNLKFLRKKYIIDELNNTVAIILPRRSGKTEGSALIIAAIVVSQPKGNCIMYNLTATQSKEFLQSVIKHLMVFKESTEFGWDLVRRDLRQLIEIKTYKYGTLNSVKSYAAALKGDGKIGSWTYERLRVSRWVATT